MILNSQLVYKSAYNVRLVMDYTIYELEYSFAITLILNTLFSIKTMSFCIVFM